MENATSYNICFLPDLSIQSSTIDISRGISSNYPSEFTLDTSNFFPHISIYHILLPNHNFDKLCQRLTDLGDHTSSFNIELDTVIISHETFVSWNCEKSSSLQNFHDKILETASPFRSSVERPSSVSILSPQEKENKQKYGMIEAGLSYRPHITLTRLKNPGDGENVLNLVKNIKKQSFTVNQFVLGLLGKHGTVNKILQTFPFNRPQNS